MQQLALVYNHCTLFAQCPSYVNSKRITETTLDSEHLSHATTAAHTWQLKMTPASSGMDHTRLTCTRQHTKYPVQASASLTLMAYTTLSGTYQYSGDWYRETGAPKQLARHTETGIDLTIDISHIAKTVLRRGTSGHQSNHQYRDANKNRYTSV